MLFRKSLPFLTLLAVFAPAVKADFILSEFMASNQQGIADEDGDRSDWIEIRNTGNVAADLNGWALTDDAANPQKWVFPAAVVPAHSQVLIFASGKNRTETGQTLHTNFSLSAAGEYLALVRPDGARASEWLPAFPPQFPDISYGLSTNVLEETWVSQNSPLKAMVPVDTSLIPQWRMPGFDETGWVLGTFAVGYQNGSVNPALGVDFGTASATPMSGTGRHSYIRIPFQVANPALVQSLRLRVNYDDGFVAWVNGTRIANSNGAPVTDPISPTALVANHGAGVFEEFPLTDASPAALTAGTNLLAIEGMNTTTGSSDAFISAELIAVLTTPGQGTTGYFATATPGLPNGGPNSLQLPVSVMPSRPSGTFSQSFDLTLSGAGAGQQIRYIMADPTGSPAAGIAGPEAASTLYSGPITISSSKLIRAAVFEGNQRGRILTAQYLQLETAAAQNTSSFTSNLPVLVLDNHGDGQPVDSGTGTYTTSLLHVFQPVGGITRLADPATGQGLPEVFSRAGARVRGSSSAGFAKKSYGMETWDETNEDMDLPLLGMAPDSDWVLNGPFLYDDTYIHNAYAFEISRRLGRWAPRTQPCELFMNQNGGKLDYTDYAGVYILTEKIKSTAARLDIASLRPGDNAGDALTGGYIFKIDRADAGEVNWTIDNSAFGAGTLPNTESGQRLVIVEPDPDTDTMEQQNYLRNTAILPFNNTLFTERAAGFTTREYRRHIDVASFVDHHIINALAMNVDALRLSAFFFKDRNQKISAGPVWDFDRALGSDDGRDANPSSWNSIGYFFDRDWWGGLFKDPQFVQEWVDRWWELRQPGQPLANSMLTTLADQMGAEIGNAAGARDAARWPENAAAGGVFLNEINAMKTWVTSRLAFIDNAAPRPPTTAVSDGPVAAGTSVVLAGAGTLFYTLDGSDPRPFGGGTASTGTAYTAPVSIDRTMVLTARRRSTFTPFPNGASSIAWSAPLQRVLLVDEVFAVAGDLSVSAINYHPFPPTAAELAVLPGIDDTAFEWLEIRNTGNRKVNTMEMSFPPGDPFDGVVKLPLRTLQPGERLLLVKNRAAFELRYGTGVSGLIAAEWLKGNLRDSGEEIRLLDRSGNPAFAFAYSDAPGWPVKADGKGAAMEYTGTAYTDADLGQSFYWQDSAAVNGTPGGAAAGPAGPVVIHEIMAQSALPFVDALELHNASASAVDLGGWFLTDRAEYTSLEDLARFRIPTGTVLAPGGYAVFTETDFNPNGAWNPAAGSPGLGEFSLDGLHGGVVRLFGRDAGGGLRLADQAAYGPMRLNEASGRRSGGTAVFDPLTSQTLFNTASALRPYPGAGSANSGVRCGPVLLREIFRSVAGGNADLAFIELFNPGTMAEPLAHWQLRGAVSRDFVATESIAAGGLLVVLPFAPADAARLAAFRQHYQIHASVPVSGPWTSAEPLGAEGEILLMRPETPSAAEPDYFPRTLEDRAAFRSGVDGWPDMAAGLSLNRREPADGSLAVNWQALAPTPGDFLLSYSTWKAGFFPTGEPASPDPDGDGLETVLEYAFDTDPLTPNDLAAILPPPSTVTDQQGLMQLVFTYTRPVNRPGVVWQVEQSSDFLDWTPVPDSAAGPVTDRETRRVAVPLGSGKNFLRLQVTVTP